MRRQRHRWCRPGFDSWHLRIWRRARISRARRQERHIIYSSSGVIRVGVSQCLGRRRRFARLFEPWFVSDIRPELFRVNLFPQFVNLSDVLPLLIAHPANERILGYLLLLHAADERLRGNRSHGICAAAPHPPLAHGANDPPGEFTRFDTDAVIRG